MSEPLPRVLLVEDDPVGRAFLSAALRPLPVELDAASDCASAIALASARPYALALVDLQLPDGDGAALLPALRARTRIAAAIALTADATARLERRLQHAGFAALAHKPLAAAALRTLVADWIGAPVPSGTAWVAGDAGGAGVSEPPHRASSDVQVQEQADVPLWDDALALSAAGGRRDIVDALRALLLSDLPAQRSAVAAAIAGNDADAALAVLHRLRAACGFCGASALDRAVCALQNAHARGCGVAEGAVAFDGECARLLA